MKRIKSLMTVMLVLLLSSVGFAFENIYKNTDSEKALRKEIINKIKSIDIASYDLTDNSVRVQFLINDKYELIVLRTDNKVLDEIVKSALNYKDIATRDLSRNTLYSINIKIVS